MVKTVALKNFRGFDDLCIPLSPITMLTGTNGVGKTSVLEGLYCLFSETKLDVSPLSRYNKSIGFIINQAANMPIGFSASYGYNYKLFWDECPSFEKQECSVEATTGNGLSWLWKYRKAKFSDLDSKLLNNYPMPVDASTEFALWTWQTRGKVIDKKAHQTQDVNEKFIRAQILAPDGGLYLLPNEARSMSSCKFMDFAYIRLQPQKLTFQTSKQLTKALSIINPKITDVRLKDVASGLSVILDDKNEVSLGTLGNGAVTWARPCLKNQ